LEVIVSFENISPGQVDVRLYFTDIRSGVIVYDNTIQETIP